MMSSTTVSAMKMNGVLASPEPRRPIAIITVAIEPGIAMKITRR